MNQNQKYSLYLSLGENKHSYVLHLMSIFLCLMSSLCLMSYYALCLPVSSYVLRFQFDGEASRDRNFTVAFYSDAGLCKRELSNSA